MQCFGSVKTLIKHKENCLIINSKQSVNLKSRSIKFKNNLEQVAVPFKVYADLECLLKGVKSGGKNTTSNAEKYQDHIPSSFAYKVVFVDNIFSKKIALYMGKNTIYRFIESILAEYYYCKKIIKKHFNKNLIMSAKDEERFQLSNNCWMCDKFIDVGDNKETNHCHITRKYGGSAHWS